MEELIGLIKSEHQEIRIAEGHVFCSCCRSEWPCGYIRAVWDWETEGGRVSE